MTQPAGNREGDSLARSAELSETEFAAQFQASYRLFWLIAAGVLHDAALAEDAVQDAAIVALRKRRQFQPGTNFVAWAGRIVRNVSANRARKEGRGRVQWVDPARFSEPIDTTPGKADLSAVPELALAAIGGLGAEAQEVDRRLMKALGQVSDVARACLMLRTLEGLDYGQISGLLGIPEGTAMSHVHRTRKLLRERLADLGPAPRRESKKG